MSLWRFCLCSPPTHSWLLPLCLPCRSPAVLGPDKDLASFGFWIISPPAHLCLCRTPSRPGPAAAQRARGETQLALRVSNLPSLQSRAAFFGRPSGSRPLWRSVFAYLLKETDPISSISPHADVFLHCSSLSSAVPETAPYPQLEIQSWAPPDSLFDVRFSSSASRTLLPLNTGMVIRFMRLLPVRMRTPKPCMSEDHLLPLNWA